VPTVSIPDDPDLDQLRRKARELQRAVRRGEPDAVALVAEHGATEPSATFPLHAAQLVVARALGFASWPKLRHYLDTVAVLHRAPDQDTPTDRVGTFLRLACLTYGDDSPAARQQAQQLLADDPSLATADVYAAAATASVDALDAFLVADPALAHREGGPHRWPPLLYLTYSRLDPPPLDDVVASTRLLLDAGADPNAGFLWHGLPTPFTALTGVFGNGERGVSDQPAHPYEAELAGLLLAAGADPNDAQTLYNRMFGDDDSHLELLFRHGLGRGSGGPWHARLGDALESPTQMLRGQLRWAIDHDMVARVRLLAAEGVDVTTPFDDGWYGVRRPVDGAAGPTPAELAAARGHDDIVELLVEHGATRPTLEPVDALVAAALRGDRARAQRLVAADPLLAAVAREARPALVVQAAANGRADAVRLLVELGWDIDRAGRGDTPSDEPWETALHTAVSRADIGLVRVLLELGAATDIADHRFQATAADWAGFFGHDAIAALLAAR
jgi:hypothetical protein